jgi:hypothetical protein
MSDGFGTILDDIRTSPPFYHLAHRVREEEIHVWKLQDRRIGSIFFLETKPPTVENKR